MTNPTGRAASTLGTRAACDLAELDEAIANLASHGLRGVLTDLTNTATSSSRNATHVGGSVVGKMDLSVK